MRLEQAGGENGGQFFTRHSVEVGALLNPVQEKKKKQKCLEKRKEPKTLKVSKRPQRAEHQQLTSLQRTRN